MFGIGMSEMIIICVVALLVFGPDELPAVVKKIARGVGEARRVTDDLRRSIDLVDDDEEDRRARAFARSATAPASSTPATSAATSPEASPEPSTGRLDETATIPGSVLTPAHGDEAPVIAAPLGRVTQGTADGDEDDAAPAVGAHGTVDDPGAMPTAGPAAASTSVASLGAAPLGAAPVKDGAASSTTEAKGMGR
jgi:sec-independent protein translocase protein TatB